MARPPRRREPTREASLFCGSAVGRGTESIGLDGLAWTTTGGCGNPASCAMFGLHRRGGPLLRTDPEPGSLDGGQDFFFLFCDDDDDDAFSLPIIHPSIHPSFPIPFSTPRFWGPVPASHCAAHPFLFLLSYPLPSPCRFLASRGCAMHLHRML